MKRTSTADAVRVVGLKERTRRVKLMTHHQSSAYVHWIEHTSGFHRSRSLNEMLLAVSSEEHVSPLSTVWYDVQLVNEPGAMFDGASRAENHRGFAATPYATAARTTRDLKAIARTAGR